MNYLFNLSNLSNFVFITLDPICQIYCLHHDFVGTLLKVCAALSHKLFRFGLTSTAPVCILVSSECLILKIYVMNYQSYVSCTNQMCLQALHLHLKVACSYHLSSFSSKTSHTPHSTAVFHHSQDT